MCLFIGGIVPGDELMAVNGRILIDATLTEGQNSLARAWNGGGVWEREMPYVFPFKRTLFILVATTAVFYWLWLNPVNPDWLIVLTHSDSLIQSRCLTSYSFIKSVKHNMENECCFHLLGLDWCCDCSVPSERVWRWSVSILINSLLFIQKYVFNLLFTVSHLLLIGIHIWSIRVLIPRQSNESGSVVYRIWQCGLCVCVCAALSQHQSVPLWTERCLKAARHCTDTATCFSTSPPPPPPPTSPSSW